VLPPAYCHSHHITPDITAAVLKPFHPHIFLIGYGDMGSRVAHDLIDTKVTCPVAAAAASYCSALIAKPVSRSNVPQPCISLIALAQSFVPGFFTVCVRLVERRQHLLNVHP
jgi:hypothetical protein